VSKGRQVHTPKAVELPRAQDAPEPTCSGCRHWREKGPAVETDPAAIRSGLVTPVIVGLCVESPPRIVMRPTVHGPFCCYPVTAADTPKCGKFEAK